MNNTQTFTQQPGFGVNTALVVGQLIAPPETTRDGSGLTIVLACLGVNGNSTVEVRTTTQTHIVNNSSIRGLVPGRLVSVTGRLDRVTQVPRGGGSPIVTMVLIAETLNWTSQPHFAFTDPRVTPPDVANWGTSINETQETHGTKPEPDTPAQKPDALKKSEPVEEKPSQSPASVPDTQEDDALKDTADALAEIGIPKPTLDIGSGDSTSFPQPPLSVLGSAPAQSQAQPSTPAPAQTPAPQPVQSDPKTGLPPLDIA